jgi:hypothetical protein
LTTCNEDPPSGFDDCKSCLESEEETVNCQNCRTCFQPLHLSVTDMEGICLSTNNIRSLFTAPAPSLAGLHGLYATLTSRYLNKHIDEKILQAIQDAEDAINAKTDDCKNDIIDNTDEAEASIKAKITDTCTSRRRLGETSGEAQPNFEDFMQSEMAQAAKQQALNQGLKEGDVDKIFSHLLDGEVGQEFDKKLRQVIQDDFSDPEKMALIDQILQSKVKANSDEYTGKLVRRLLSDATDSQTRKLDGK